ncbi:glycine-rich RNA-binding protein 3, mitochondrial-like precursor [Nicotiana tabacum]|uniref:RNA-binding protein n=1 Tax=Nicotiana tabacum TaxID=4097 RepID=Q941H9_TOBAC|nr:glycine-rich RNA-binding protein 3, mitochondrial-like precursor [Nicotiana tabacum]AAL07518.1 RNA-binding protein precursor [Nicotiana tabacum]
MAFFNRVGSILKQSVSKHSNLELSASNASLFQAIRSMSSSKLFVGGLSYGTDESSLKEAFSQYGDVIEARVIMDRDTGRSRGFGFISFPSSEEAASALQAMDGQDLHGRRIRVNYATEKRRAGFGGGYGGGGGGFNYGGEGGNSAGAGGYPTNNYGGGFSGGNTSAGGYGSYGGGSNYGNDNSSPAEGGVGYGSANYGNTPNSNYSGPGNSFSGGYDGGNNGNGFGESPGASFNGGQEQVSVDQGTQSINEDIGQETSEGNYRDDDDEPKDFANSRG